MIQKIVVLALSLLLCVSNIYSKSDLERDRSNVTGHCMLEKAKAEVNRTADIQQKARETTRKQAHEYSNATRAMLNAARSLEEVAEENLRCAQRKHDMATQVRENAEKEASMRFELIAIETPIN